MEHKYKTTHEYKTTWYTSFLGVRMQHNYGLYKTFDDVLVDNPQIERFVEIGTGGGAVSVILALHATQRDTHLLTFDTQTRGHKPKVDRIFKKLDVEFVEEDVFENIERIQKHIDGKPAFLFCDGGNKILEVNTFAPLLPSGSVIAAHDYGREVYPENVKDAHVGYVPLYEERWLDTDIQIFTCFHKKL